MSKKAFKASVSVAALGAGIAAVKSHVDREKKGRPPNAKKQ